MPEQISVHFDHVAFSAQKRGGVSRYFAELASDFGRRDAVRVSIHAPLYVADSLAAARKNGVHLAGLHVPAFRGATFIGNMLARIFPAGDASDIFHATWYPSLRPPNCRKYVVTVHDLIAERFPQQVRNSSQQSDLKAAAVEAADLVMCVSNQTRDDLIRMLGVDASKIAVSPLASSIGTVRPAQAARRPPYILYVGQRAGYKNFESLAQAFKASRLLRRHFELVCFGGPKFNARELQLLSGLSSSGRGAVTLLQGDDSDLSALYRNASIFVCPSLYEGFGLPVLEAMSCGCPVVATARGSIPEVGGDAIAYSGDVTAEAVREALESVVFDEARLAVMRSAGLTRSDDFSWMRTADTTLAAYDRFLRS